MYSPDILSTITMDLNLNSDKYYFQSNGSINSVFCKFIISDSQVNNLLMACIEDEARRAKTMWGFDVQQGSVQWLINQQVTILDEVTSNRNHLTFLVLTLSFSVDLLN